MAARAVAAASAAPAEPAKADERAQSANASPESGSALLAEDPSEGGYDEEQWQRSMTDDHVGASGEEEPDVAEIDSDASRESGALPELDELLKNVPENSRELIDSLFRGRFTSVKVIDRKKLL